MHQFLLKNDLKLIFYMVFPNGWTSLHIAAKDGSTEIFKFLARKVENPSGFTPFQTAAQYGSTEIFKFLGTSIGKFSLLAD